MLPYQINSTNTAVLIVDLQGWYCDQQSYMAQKFKWDCRPVDEICKRHVSFVSELRTLLSPHHIIWVRRLPTGRKVEGKEDFRFLDALKPGGFSYHIVQPNRCEAEALKAHPSAFHVDTRVRTVGFTDIVLPQESNMFTLPPKNLDEYLKTIGVKTVAVGGVFDPHCVAGTIWGASIFGYDCFYLNDLVAAPAGKEFAIQVEGQKIIRDMISRPIASQAFLSALRSENKVAIQPS